MPRRASTRTGADGFLARLPDLSGAELTLTVTQAVAVEPDRVLALVRVAGGRMTDFWMVDALPAKSAAFWAGETSLK